MQDATCAHRDVQIIERSTMVERGGQQFCCANWANAMTADAATSAASGSARVG